MHSNNTSAYTILSVIPQGCKHCNTSTTHFPRTQPTWEVQGLPLFGIVLNEFGSKVDAVHFDRPHGQCGVGVLGVVGHSAGLTETSVLRGRGRVGCDVEQGRETRSTDQSPYQAAD